MRKGVIPSSNERIMVNFRIPRYLKNFPRLPTRPWYLSCPISSAKDARIVIRRGVNAGVFGPNSQAVRTTTINPNPKHGRSTFPANMTPITIPENTAEENLSNVISVPIKTPLVPEVRKHKIAEFLRSPNVSASFSVAPAKGQMRIIRIRLDIGTLSQLY